MFGRSHGMLDLEEHFFKLMDRGLETVSSCMGLKNTFQASMGLRKGFEVTSERNEDPAN